MKSNYKHLGDYIHEVNNRNKELHEIPLLGVSITKKFIPSIANIVGTDMSTYKLIAKNQFAYGPVTSRNGEKISIALSDEHENAMVSQAYTVFDVNDANEVLPEYLMMWFRRTEFDRYARFMSHGSAREIFSWTELCDTLLPIPSIEKQREIVKEYNVIQNRIALNNQLIAKLEETAQTIYKQWFVDFEGKLEIKSLGELCSLITDGKHGDCKDELNSGYYFISVKDLNNEKINYRNARQITKKDFEETHKRTQLKSGDILLTNAGTIGRMAIVHDQIETNNTTFQKSVAILKPKSMIVKSHFLYLLLKMNLKDIIDLAGGSTQSNLLLGDLRNFEVGYPGYDNVCILEDLVKPIFVSLANRKNENSKLAEINELLLARMTKVESEIETVIN